MNKSIKKNYFYNLFYQVLVILLPIFSTPYLSRTLGADGIGTYSYTISISTYFILLGSLGISLYGQREIAYCQKDLKKRSRIFWELFFLRSITMVFSIVLFYFIYAREGDYSLYYKILVLELFANIFDISWLYQGMEDFKKIVVKNTIVKIIGITCVFAFVKGPDDIAIYLLIYVLNLLFGNFSLWFKLKEYVSRVSLPDLKPFSHLKDVFLLFLPQIAIQIYVVLDKTMIGLLSNNMFEVGYYDQTQKIVKMLLTVVSSMAAVMIPRIAKYYSESDYKHIEEYMMKTFRFIYFLGFPIICGLMAVSSNFVPFFFGEGYDKVVGLMIFMSPIILLIGLSGSIGNQYLLVTKKQKEFTISVVCGAVLNCLFNYLFIPIYLSYGATFATLIAEFSVTALQIFFVRKTLSFSKMVCYGLPYLFASVCMAVLCVLIDFFVPTYLLALLLQIVFGGLFYFLILFLLKDSFFLEHVQKVLRFRKS